MQIRRQELWERNYNMRPYLADVSDEQLIDRFNYINQNLINLTPEGKMGIETDQTVMGYWMELLTHTFREFNRRGGTPAKIANSILPKPTYPTPHKMADKETSQPLIEGAYLIRYGKKEHIKEMLDCGKILLKQPF